MRLGWVLGWLVRERAGGAAVLCARALCASVALQQTHMTILRDKALGSYKRGSPTPTPLYTLSISDCGHAVSHGV